MLLIKYVVLIIILSEFLDVLVWLLRPVLSSILICEDLYLPLMLSVVLALINCDVLMNVFGSDAALQILHGQPLFERRRLPILTYFGYVPV